MAPFTVATSVTNLELSAAVTVLSLVMLLLSVMAIRDILKAVKAKRRSGIYRRCARAFVMILLLIPVVRFSYVEMHLLWSPEYAEGTTVGFCQVFARGIGIEFRYDVKGITYTNCNTYHPLIKEDIDVPGGVYLVRYSARFPGKGRIDLRNPSDRPATN